MARARLKQLVESPILRGFDRELPYVALEHVESHMGRTVNGFQQQTRNADDNVLFEPGDVLFGKLRPYLVKVLNPDYVGCASGEFLVLRPRTDLCSRFLYYLCLSRPFTDWADATSYGVKMPRTTWEAAGDFEVDVPSVPEQRAIADFLDRESARIDALIGAKSRLVKAVVEKRAGVLDDTCWSETPAPIAAGRVVRAVEQGWSPDCADRPASAESWGVLKASSVKDLRFDARENKEFPDDLVPRRDLEVHEGDVLINRASGSPTLAGSAAVAEIVRPRLMLCDKVFRVRVGDSYLERFFVYSFSSATARRFIQSHLTGVVGTAYNLPQQVLLRVPVPDLPLDEQRRRTGFLDRYLVGTERLLDSITRSVDLLSEHRQALMTAAVTGQNQRH